MNEPAIPIYRCVTVAAWAVTALLILGAWIGFLVGLDGLSRVLGFSGCSMSAVAATFNVRCYASALSRLIRLANGLPPAQTRRSLRSVAD